jgi:hypothetical protein
MYQDPPDFSAFDTLIAEQLDILSQDLEALHEGTASVLAAVGLGRRMCQRLPAPVLAPHLTKALSPVGIGEQAGN